MLLMLTARKISGDGFTYQNLVRGIACKNHWTKFSHTFSIHENPNIVYLLLGTSCTENSLLTDYFVKDVSVKEKRSVL
jgi:hypothetical protein